MAQTAKKVKEEIKKEVDRIPPTTDRNLMGALSYVWFISIVMLVVKRQDEFVQFHAKQGVILFLGTLVGFIPIFGWLIFMFSIVGMVVGFLMAWQGKRYQIPFVGTLAKKISL